MKASLQKQDSGRKKSSDTYYPESPVSTGGRGMGL